MKKMKILAVLMCAVMVVGMLAGCGAEKAQGGKKLVMATNAAFPPYEYYEDGVAVGIDVDIMKAIADKLGMELEVADMEFGSIITAVATGKADVGAAAITKTEDRLKSVNFTSTYATGDFGDDHMIRYNKGADAVQALSSGKCSAVIIDNGPAKVFVETNDGLVLLETPYAEEEYSFEISYDNQELYDQVNKALEELIADGTIQSIVDKYIAVK